MARTIVVGGGPAGSIAALALRKLGEEVVVYEKETFPRYRIGESLLPGTLSILRRLGLTEKLEEHQYVKKPSATFLWGADQAPWTFSFATARSAPWICDHAIQVHRADFDALLLQTARDRGATVHEGAQVREIDLRDGVGVRVGLEMNGETRTVEGDFLIDASGAGSPLVRKLQTRKYDAFYRSLAVWSYFQQPDPFTGALKGTTYSITFQDGWVWMIPLRGDVYSVGVVVDQSKAKELSEQGKEAFFTATLARCRRAMDILKDAKRVDDVRVVQDWSYESETFSDKNFFLCGDSACFTDPLFSQGVHLAAQSAVRAAASVRRLREQPREAPAIHRWYNESYRETYEQYHEFLASFYTFASFTEPASAFWEKRRIAESSDDRLARKKWFDRLVTRSEAGDASVAGFRDRAATMIAIGKHPRIELSDQFSEAELTPARVRWVSDLTRKLNSIAQMRWEGERVLLQPYYRVDAHTFELRLDQVIANERGARMTKYGLDERHRRIFEELTTSPVGYRELERRLADADRDGSSSQIVIRMMEAGLVRGYDREGRQVLVQDRLRFDGVGEEYEV